MPLWFVPSFAADPLPGAKPLTEDGDLAAKMVDGMHQYLDRATAASVERRQQFWTPDFASPDAYAKSIEPNRARLRKRLGVVDARVPPKLEYVGGPGEPAFVGEFDGCRVHAVRWAVLPGVDAEGYLIEPKGPPAADVVAVPHADQTPEQVAFLGPDRFALAVAAAGCRVLVPTLVDRAADGPADPRTGKAVAQPRREFVHRMAFEMGRTLAGYEVQKVLAAADWFAAGGEARPLGVIGYGDGGMVALYAAALDTRFRACGCSAYFAPREGLAGEPFDRNVWRLLTEFGDAEVAALVHPRALTRDPDAATDYDPKFWPAWPGPGGP